MTGFRVLQRFDSARPLPCLLVVMLCLSSAWLGADWLSADETASAEQAEKLFTLKVLPLLKQKCHGCHGEDPDDLKGQFDIRTREALLQGGESEEPAIVVGSPQDSPLYQAVLWETYEMPPKENDRLTKQETDWIRDWIAAGAPWPTAARQDEIREVESRVIENEDGVIISTSGGLNDQWTYRRYQPEEVWAFRPVRDKQQLGAIADGTHPVDYFINQRLDQAGLQPGSEADPATLLRRATYDLTGLPPSPDEIKSFSEAWERDSDQAWRDLIDRLLDSPHYGERWGQHWLDVVRYADTAGFSNDYERSNAWRYRDYVIRSFNEDKAFDEFIVEQIAGDEMEAEKVQEAAGDDAPAPPYTPDSSRIIATSFLRMGPWGTAMIPQPEARQLYLDDLVHNVGQTFLSIPMRCCKCHDHKFDPVPTRDYYRMYASFAGTQPAEVSASFLPEENLSGFEDKKQLVESLLKYADDDRLRIVDKRESSAKKWYAENNLPYKNEEDRRKDPEDMKPPRHSGLDYVDEGTLKVREQDVWIWTRRLERYKPMVQGVYNGPDVHYNGRKLRKPNKIDQKWRPDNFILGGGSLESKMDSVKPGVLSATGVPARDVPARDDPARDDSDQDAFTVPDGLQGRRLALARWIADPKNPLTTRSIVNRIWQHHFGQGIVRTPNNLGAKGSKPTHPELLDWLATEFIENGWKFKHLHRVIMMSDAYRRSGRYTDLKQLDTVDPNNELLARFAPRRLTAEELRDSMLMVTGELNPEIGGVPIMPEINMEVALQPRMIQFSIAPAHQPSRTPQERNRRSIYAYRVRGQADPFLEIMNLPNPNESCQTRDTAVVTPQAFTLMNSDTVTDRSIAFALRLQNESDDLESQVARAFALAFGRQPRAEEQQRLKQYIAEMQKYHDANPPKEIEYPRTITRSLVEEFSGKPFEYTEWLPVYEDYVPDAKPWTVNASTRALADVCLLIFNSNEFVYVY